MRSCSCISFRRCLSLRLTHVVASDMMVLACRKVVASEMVMVASSLKACKLEELRKLEDCKLEDCLESCKLEHCKLDLEKMVVQNFYKVVTHYLKACKLE